ncbi:MAG TPA: peptide ABC transporter substrate-binding protein [Saprospiraceae bacterium]|jgi:peptide/nickel transport system substrate-binding protein|nr:MAG: extracellular solute-binding protein [Candidatus Parvibacillus calidus]MBX2938334.1 peptide ABC transporter substrate-binding protein [Saprospiraceae bacterium]MBK7740969.1 peptide ABC transporter substrate-binding protein [Candidatus Parvibacillus calidus]MBX7179748.1 peptide ABC transporter substrate-binding protein [Saprospiraceae bacterium]MCB0591719.1 peptide ABC transporter substrate-binding protein [Saprospiraceae bacterium]
MKPGRLIITGGLVLCLFLFDSCRKEPRVALDTVNVAIAESPETLFPYKAKSVVAGQVISKIYLPLADFNPMTLELEPVLLESIPKPEIDSTGERYHFRILKEASWSDGRPVTVSDVLYTMMFIVNPFGNHGSVRSTLANIDDLSFQDPTSKEFSVTFNGEYHLDLEAFTNIPLLPAHVMDPDHLTAAYTWRQMTVGIDSLRMGQDSTTLIRIAGQSKLLERDFTKQVGTGPYKVSEWVPNQRLTLVRIEQYWGMPLAETYTEFQAFPATINYLIFPEVSTAMAALKAGQVNVMPEVNEEILDQVRSDATLAKNFDVLSADVLQYYYIGLNNAGPMLGDLNVRRAMNHLVNVDRIIQTLMHGNAEKVKSPILAQKPYYVSNLPDIEYNPAKARAILDQFGYHEIGADGIRTKKINGQPMRMSFTILTTGKQLGRDVATLLINEARKVGIEVKMETMDFPKILERIKSGKYDMANLVVKQFPGLDDPYLAWNSTNAFGKGSNYCNVNNPAIDRITEEIRTAPSQADRYKLYREFQVKLAEQYPVIFLFSPKNQILIQEGLTMVTSPKRPGYFENTVK